MNESVEREVRFAVVIYGGVSLAIYINGVVQEMLHMVRSTAIAEERLTGLEKVYRKLGCIVAAQRPPDKGESVDDAIVLRFFAPI